MADFFTKIVEVNERSGQNIKLTVELTCTGNMAKFSNIQIAGKVMELLEEIDMKKDKQYTLKEIIEGLQMFCDKGYFVKNLQMERPIKEKPKKREEADANAWREWLTTNELTIQITLDK